jgi:hypothetical protein
MVTVASSGYFKSDYCGRERALFQRRAHAVVTAGQTPAPLPKPIVRVPFRIDALSASRPRP